MDISSNAYEIDYQHYESLQRIHRILFHELYYWAGEFRTVNIYKPERVLNGLSISYSDKERIPFDLKGVFRWANARTWHYSNPNLAADFAMFMTKLWRIHPYREGNTRTVSVFMKLFADANKLDFNAQILSKHTSYLRNALVLAAVDEASEPQYLITMISDALNLKDIAGVVESDEKSNNYQIIEQYDVSEYKEKPFKTDFDLK